MSFGHWQARTKLRRTDILFSEYLRTLRNFTCEKCGRDCSNFHQQLTCSHFFGRRKESVRFDEENCSALCRSCHNYFEEHKVEYAEWLRNRLGDQEFGLLNLRMNTVVKRDDEMQKIIINQKMKELKDGMEKISKT
jgi:hypothetical protein